MEREEQGRASKHIEFGWSEQSKDNQIIVELEDKIKLIIIYRIGLDQNSAYAVIISIKPT